MNNFVPYYKENKLFCRIILIFSVFVIAVLLMFNFKGHDYPYHIQRIASITEEIRFKGLGAFPIRIFSTNEFSYGYASPLFYGDIFLYPFALLNLLGLNAIYCYRLMLISIVILSFSSMYYCTKQISKDIQTSLICAVIYTCSSYFAVDVFVRSAIGESFAFIFLPLACYGFYCTVINEEMPKKHRLFLALGMAGLLVTHLISSLLTAIFMAIFAIIYYKNIVKNPKIIFNVILLALLTIALSAFFFFPLLEQMLSAKFYTTAHTLYNFGSWKIRWASWIGPHAFWKLQGDRFPELRDSSWFPGGFGLVLITLFGVWIFNFKKLKKSIMITTLCIALILILMAQGLIIPIDILGKVFGFMQFPYRILLMSTLFMSISGAYMVYILKNKKVNMLLLVVSIISCLMIIVTSYSIIYKENPSVNDEYSLTTDQIGNGEYIPAELIETMSTSSPSAYCQQRGDTVEANHNDVTHSHENDRHGTIEITYSNNHYNDTSFELPLLMYKGYTAFDRNTKQKYSVSTSEHGLVSVNVSNIQSGDIVVKYSGTAVQHISDVISILAIIALIIYLINPELLDRIRKKFLKYQSQS